MRAFVISGLLVSPLFASAAPLITSYQGTIGDNNTLTISGSQFGSKATRTAKPLLYADFEGTIDPNNLLGQAAAWVEIQHATYQTMEKHAGNGSAGSVDAWRDDIHNLVYTLPPMNYGEKIYISFWRKVTYSVTRPENWKWLRLWPLNRGGYNNWYIGSQKDGGRIKYWESLAGKQNCGEGPGLRQYGAYPEPNSTWRLEEYLLQYPTGKSKTDGRYIIKINGALVHDFQRWQVDCGPAPTPSPSPAPPPSLARGINIQDDPSNFDPASGEVFKDNVVIDKGWSRVYLGNALTIGAATNLEYQPASSWTNNTITIQQKFGTLGNPKYLFVCDNNNSCSPGYRLP